MDTGQFNQELKNEMEVLDEKHRKATMEHLQVLKNLTTIIILKKHQKKQAF